MAHGAMQCDKGTLRSLKNYASLAFTAALRRGRAKIISKKSKHDISDQTA
jgi:hypothetical protein